MRKWMISLLSVLVLAFIFTGCGGSDGSSVGSSVSTDTGTDTGAGDVDSTDSSDYQETTVTVNGKEVASEDNYFGLSSELGTPPVNPGQE